MLHTVLHIQLKKNARIRLCTSFFIHILFHWITFNHMDHSGEERHALADGMHIGADLHNLHLRNDSPPPEHRKQQQGDSKLSPQSIYPPIQPILYRTFDWYASQKDALTGLDFENTNRTAARPINKIKSPQLESVERGVKVGNRYFYKQFSEDHREAGRLIEIADQYIVFQKQDRGYENKLTIRWESIEVIWNPTGQEEIWVNPLKGKKYKRVLNDMEKRKGWKADKPPSANGNRKLEATVRTSIDPARSAMFNMKTPDPYNVTRK